MDLALLGVFALLVRVPAVLAERHLTFDDGTFSASALAMRDGDAPFRAVFSSQAPLFLPLVWLGDLLGLRTTDSTRTLAVVSGVVLVLATYLAARHLTDRLGALVAAGLVAASGSVLWVTGPLAADGPALAFVMLALWAALAQRDRPRLSSALLVGLATGASLASKTIEVPAVVPIALILLWPLLARLRDDRRVDRDALAALVVAAGAAVAVYVLAALPWGWSDVWDQAVRYRLEAESDRDPVGNFRKILSTSWDRDLVVWAAAAVTAVSALVFRGPRRERVVPEAGPGDRPPAPSLLLWAYLVVSVLWLTFVVFPLFRPHVSLLVPPAALLVGYHRPPLRIVAASLVILVPLWLWNDAEILRPSPYTAAEAAVVEALEDLPDGAWAISDEPGYLWRAGVRTTADLVDPSVIRFQQGRITEDDLVEQASEEPVCAVLVTADARFGSEEYAPRLPERLVEVGYERHPASSEDLRLYVRPDCPR